MRNGIFAENTAFSVDVSKKPRLGRSWGEDFLPQTPDWEKLTGRCSSRQTLDGCVPQAPSRKLIRLNWGLIF
ncbi:hypothetical protein [Calothrix sp. UHCC 0171]|uniref:hypothetical protein n=1 Tax=Calothrix sp. UHCC 0171 TaxID=3110245 RepID=UPI002B2043CB|nr:hypothetical protein [Calothrix sp. UHCC 0171]MEA5572675.1 hypothetical protein [Calothrix sp. UHCC 0171]